MKQLGLGKLDVQPNLPVVSWLAMLLVYHLFRTWLLAKILGHLNLSLFSQACNCSVSVYHAWTIWSYDTHFWFWFTCLFLSVSGSYEALECHALPHSLPTPSALPHTLPRPFFLWRSIKTAFKKSFEDFYHYCLWCNKVQSIQ